MTAIKSLHVGVLVAALSLSACSGEGDPGDPEQPGDTDGGDEGAGDGGDGGDGADDGDGGEAEDALCRDAVIEPVTSKPSELASDSSLAVTTSGVVHVAFTAEASTSAGDPTTAIFVTRLAGGDWSEPERVPADADLAHQTPRLIADGETLHLAWSTTRAGSAVRDIFHAMRSEAGEWSEPRDLTGEENTGARTSTAVHDLALSGSGVLAVVYGTLDPEDEVQQQELPRVQFLEGGEPVAASSDASVEGFPCRQATAVYDTSDTLHVVATCFPDGEPGHSALWWGTNTAGKWETSAYLLATLFGLHLSPTVINLSAPYANLIWEERSGCAGGTCGNIVYGLLDDPQGAISGADLSPLSPADTGIAAPSAAVDPAGRVSIVFDHAGAGPAGDIFVTRSVEAATFVETPPFYEPCRLTVEPDGDERAPQTVVDPSTGDVHILFQAVEGEGARLAHARLPAAP